MTRFFLLSMMLAALSLSGCADSLIANEPGDASRAGNSPNPVGHLPVTREPNPLGPDAPPF